MNFVNFIATLLFSFKAKEEISEFKKSMLTNIVFGLLVGLLSFTGILFAGSFLYEWLLVENFTSLQSKGIIILSIIITVFSLCLYLKKQKNTGKEEDPEFNFGIDEIVQEFKKGFEQGQNKK